MSIACGQNATYFSYWAKTDRQDSSAVPGYHLLPYHGLDVAACAHVILRREDGLRRRMAALLGVNEGAAVELVTFLVGLHDGGKFAEGFQNQDRHLFEHLRGRSSRKPYHVYHDTLGYRLWVEKLVGPAFDDDWFGLKGLGLMRRDLNYDLKPLWEAVTGHHGQPPRTGREATSGEHFDEESTAAAIAYANACRDLFIDGTIWTNIGGYLDESTIPASWLLAGLTVAADWLGSNDRYFEFREDTVALDTYWRRTALPAAREAVGNSGILSSPPASSTGFETLFPDYSPTPMQAYAADVALADGPQLFAIEDATGSGKTEAALVLAQRMMAAGRASGVYVALPTMATANAMYGRLVESYQKLFEDPGDVSLILAHGARDLSDTFKRSVDLGAQRNRRDETYADDELSGAAQCTRWLADSRKTALLAGIGVGTIDQALMGVLPSRHQSLRLLGMSRSVLIVDEVHAYDSYMNELLMRLLKFHASNGGSAILLSATLPQTMRQELSNAFCAGLGAAPPDLRQQYFPMATHVAGDQTDEAEIERSTRSKHRVSVAFEDDRGACVDQLVQVARDDGCGCWIRNTVNDAIDAYHLLCGEVGADNVILFHARFAMVDRQRIEERVLHLFGPESTPRQRASKIVIATQVVEQSLDLDFDFMISDMAPIELLIQRAGRLHRHDHRPERGEPTLVVHGPDPRADAPDEDWYKDVLPAASFVYPHVARLWLGARALHEAGCIDIPGRARELVEAVYGVDPAKAAPSALVEASAEAVSDQCVERSMGRHNALNLERGYGAESSMDWFEDTRTPTRLGDPTTTLRLGRIDADSVQPWAADGRARWRRSQVDIRTTKVADEAAWTGALASGAARAKDTMADCGEWSVLVPLRCTSDRTWHGRARRPDGQTVDITYSKTFGLQLDRDDHS